MREDQFYIVLPSNSSMHVYPDNTTTHFCTYLPQQISLEGQWSVGLTEIQIPYTSQHFSNDKQDRFLNLYTVTEKEAELTQEVVVNGAYKSRRPEYPDPVAGETQGWVEEGVYKNIESLIIDLNSLHREHLQFHISSCGYIILNQICGCYLHTISMSKTLQNILGFESPRVFDHQGKIYQCH